MRFAVLAERETAAVGPEGNELSPEHEMSSDTLTSVVSATARLPSNDVFT